MNYYKKMLEIKPKENALILGIETSCDETAASVVLGGRKILSDIIISSATEHVRFGGVVPEIASRAHTSAVLTAVSSALKEAGVTAEDLDGIAVTEGAGLLGALLVGVSFAKALSFASGKPLIPVNHIRGHLAAAYLADENLKPPFVSLLASGGHTAVIYVENYYDHKVYGSTLDDAVGEAFDKVARVLKLEYPGGPNIERLAKNGKNTVLLPKMLKGNNGFDFSYSGLKTAVINYVHNKEQVGDTVDKENVACSFQSSAIDVLVEKVVKLALLKNSKTVTAGGGVAANGYLREKLKAECDKYSIKLVLPEKRYCTDNACMIAAEGYLQYKIKNFADLSLNAKASIPLR